MWVVVQSTWLLSMTEHGPYCFMEDLIGCVEIKSPSMWMNTGTVFCQINTKLGGIIMKPKDVKQKIVCPVLPTLQTAHECSVRQIAKQHFNNCNPGYF